MKRQPKIVAMVQLPPPMHGAARMNQHAIEALARQFDVLVLEMNFTRDLSDLDRPSLRKLTRALWLLLRLVGALPRAKALYICFAPTGGAYIRDCLYVLIAKMFRVPAVLHLHGRGLPAMRQSRLALAFQKTVFANQSVIQLGENLRSEIAGLACHATIISNCLEPNAITDPARGDWHPSKPLKLLWLSNLFRAKGIETLIAACQILRERGINFELTIAGAEGDISARQLRDLLEHYGIMDTAIYIGSVEGKGKANAFSNADLFVFPSHYANEAQPLVVLEAMAAGVPVITSDIATLPEFVREGQTGFLCPPQNPTALAETIIRAIEYPDETSRMRNAAYELCKAHFNQDRFTVQITSLMSEVIGSDVQNRSQSLSSDMKRAPTTQIKSGDRPNGS
ncbi:MAG: glycosyltransferase family 4 protein [Thalassospira sp.]|uniref:glycosyltransferase family 4 protein n=1 Tax=Thalassospira sp. TaxID=1912094 RepID=UPI003A8BEB0B